MNKIPLLLILASCVSRPAIWDVWPVSDNIANKSTYPITSSSGQGKAFVVADYHAITSAKVCSEGNVNSLTLHTAVGRMPAEIVTLDHNLCLVKTAFKLNNSMIIARKMPLRDKRVSSSNKHGTRLSRYEISIPYNLASTGAPVYDGCGVVGVIQGPRISGEPGSRITGSKELQLFLQDSGLDYEIEPIPPGDIDMGGNPGGEKHSDIEGYFNYGHGGCR